MRSLMALKENYTKEFVRVEEAWKKLLNYRLAVFILLLGMLVLPFKTMTTKVVVGLVPFMLFVWSVVRAKRYKVEMARLKGLLLVIEDYEARESSSVLNNDTGLLLNIESDLITDLNLLGRGSLFQYLNCARTLGGKEQLIRDLSSGITIKRARERRAGIRELLQNLSLVLEFQERLDRIKGVSSIRAHHFLDGFVMKRPFNMWDLLISVILSLCFMGSLLLFALGRLPGLVPVVLFVIQLTSGMLYERYYGYELGQVDQVLRGLRDLEGVMEVILKNDFEEHSLREMQARIRKASGIKKNLQTLSALESFRRSLISNLFVNTFLSWNRLLVLLYKTMVGKDKPHLMDALLVIEELEVMVSLSTINILKDHTSEPEIHEDVWLDIKGLYQPLIKESECVPNDITSSAQVNIITGSNMSGKTFFMKSIAMNLLLAYAGSFVNADGFKVPELQIFSSINVQDDVTKGISTFYAELLRVQEMLEYRDGPFIAFIDEIFKGTNYEDRLLGARTVIEKLQGRPALVFITTHDRELSRLEGVVNYHFEENYRNGIMDFDHKIKPGTTSTTNARELMKELGILQ